MTSVLELRRLSQRDLCGGFSCGTEVLDDFIRRYAKQQERRQQSATTLALVAGDIAGFVTCLPGAVDSHRLSSVLTGLPRQPVPVLVLARMATDTRFKGMRVGSTLLGSVVLPNADQLARSLGCVGIRVDAKAAAIAFYARYGFVSLEMDNESLVTPMFLTMEKVRRAADSGP